MGCQLIALFLAYAPAIHSRCLAQSNTALCKLHRFGQVCSSANTITNNTMKVQLYDKNGKPSTYHHPFPLLQNIPYTIGRQQQAVFGKKYKKKTVQQFLCFFKQFQFVVLRIFSAILANNCFLNLL